MSFITAHWPAIVSVLSALVVVAREIVHLTGSTKDDQIEAQVEAVLSKLGVINVPAQAPADAPADPAAK